MNTRDFKVTLAYALTYYTPTIPAVVDTRREAEVSIPVTTITRKEAEKKFRVLKKTVTKRCRVVHGIKSRKEFLFTQKTDHSYGGGIRKLPEEVRDVEFEIRSYEGVWYRKVYCSLGSGPISDLPANPNEHIQNIIECTEHAMWVSHTNNYTKGKSYTYGTASEAHRLAPFGKYDDISLEVIPGDAQFIANSGHDLGDAIAHTRSFTDKFIILLEDENDKRGELWEAIDNTEPWPGEA